MRLPNVLLIAFGLLIAACTADQSGDVTLDTTPMTGASTTTTTTTTSDSTTTLQPGASQLGASCTSPEGFTVSYPESWKTNAGGVVAECTMFDPEDFAVPEGTNERVAAITFYIEQIDYEEATSIDHDLVRDREIRSIDGRRAERIESVTGEDSPLPEGTAITRYYIDLGLRTGETGRVLVADTLDIPAINYARSQEVLDRMVPTVEIEPTAIAGADAVTEFGAPPTASPEFPASGDPALLTDVRFGKHDGFDRVVFEFQGESALAYSVEYVEETVTISGDAIGIAGSHILEVTVTPASGLDRTGNEPVPTYTGPRRIAVDGQLASELVQVEDFEGALRWAIGLEMAANIAVNTLADPLRLVVDIATE